MNISEIRAFLDKTFLRNRQGLVTPIKIREAFNQVLTHIEEAEYSKVLGPIEVEFAQHDDPRIFTEIARLRIPYDFIGRSKSFTIWLNFFLDLREEARIPPRLGMARAGLRLLRETALGVEEVDFVDISLEDVWNFPDFQVSKVVLMLEPGFDKGYINECTYIVEGAMLYPPDADIAIAITKRIAVRALVNHGYIHVQTVRREDDG